MEKVERGPSSLLVSCHKDNLLHFPHDYLLMCLPILTVGEDCPLRGRLLKQQ